MKRLRLLFTAAIAISFFMTGVASAQAPTTSTPPSSSSTPVTGPATGGGTSSGKCGDTKTQFITCDSKTGVGTINDLIKIVLMIMTVLIGIVAVGGLAYGGILYASAQDNQNQVNSAMTIIRNIVIGLVLYGFTIAIINWLIPGGVIG